MSSLAHQLMASLFLLAVSIPATAQMTGSPARDNAKLQAPQIKMVEGARDASINAYTTSNTDHSGGVAWIDYNGDYWPDLFLTNGFSADHWLYQNNGDGTFTDVSYLVPKSDLFRESCAALFGDLDNDGDSDLLVIVDSIVPTNFALGGPNLLYMNNGDGTFTEEGLVRGIIDPLGRRNTTGALADFDRDGDLDAYLGMRAIGLFPLTHFDWYAQNDGAGSFTDVTAGSGLDGVGRNAQVALPFDVDLDGWMDLYVGNVGVLPGGYMPADSHDHLYLNDGTGLSFGDLIGVGLTTGNDASAVMGADIGDVDNDGDWDMYLTDVPTEGDNPIGNVLYLGDSKGGFDDNSCDVAGVCANVSTWPCNFADFDCDGWIDLYTGTTSPFVEDLLYRNNQDGTFSASPQPQMIGNSVRGGSTADFDGDGDVDVMFWNTNQNSTLYRNETEGQGHWFQLKLHGVTSNRDAIGARVSLTSAGQTQMRRVSGGDSAHSQQELMLHFGLGNKTVVDSLEISWPSGGTQVLSNLGVDEVVFVSEATGVVNEAVTGLVATWSTSAQEIELEVSSNFGGRTAFDASGFGSLAWDPNSLSFGATFSSVPSTPGSVTLVSRRGTSFPISVTTIP